MTNKMVAGAGQGRCRKCGRALLSDEIAMTKKLINRGTSIYYCTDCLARAFDVTREDILAKIQYFKESGCTLFAADHAGIP